MIKEICGKKAGKAVKNLISPQQEADSPDASGYEAVTIQHLHHLVELLLDITQEFLVSHRQCGEQPLQRHCCAHLVTHKHLQLDSDHSTLKEN